MGLAVGVHPKTSVSAPCPVCDTWDAELVADRDRYGQPLTTVACLRCGLLRTDPMPSEADLCAFYSAHYRQSYKGVRRPKPKHIYRAALLADSRLDRLRSVLPPPQRLLDVGSGSGEFCLLAQSRGYQITGIEADPEFSEHARAEYGASVITVDVAEADFAAETFDGVTLFHVLEHLPDPVKVLQAVRKWVRPLGMLVVEVPNAISPNQHPRKRFHYAHVIGFTASSLRLCLRASGWQLTELTLDGDERNLFAVAVKKAEVAADGGVEQTVSQATPPGRYYLQPQTYIRWFRRMRQFASEYAAVAKSRSAREIAEGAARPAAGRQDLKIR